MAREFEGPLSESDLAWLKARHPESYVSRLVELHGLEEGANEAPTDPTNPEGAGDGSQTGEGTNGEGQVPEGNDGAGDGADEDLIGDDSGDPAGDPADGAKEEFDVVGSTEAEVKTWSESASDEDKASALVAEQARTDREPRKGVVSLLS